MAKDITTATLDLSGVTVTVGNDFVGDVKLAIDQTPGLSMTVLEADLLIAALNVAKERCKEES